MSIINFFFFFDKYYSILSINSYLILVLYSIFIKCLFNHNDIMIIIIIK